MKTCDQNYKTTKVQKLQMYLQIVDHKHYIQIVHLSFQKFTVGACNFKKEQTNYIFERIVNILRNGLFVFFVRVK